MPRCASVAQVRNTRGTAATTSPLLDPGDVISKRVSCGAYHGVRGSLLTLRYVAYIDTPQGPLDPIILAKARETRGAPVEWHTRKSRLRRATRCSYCERVDEAAFCYDSTAHRRRARRPRSTHVAAHEITKLLVCGWEYPSRDQARIDLLQTAQFTPGTVLCLLQEAVRRRHRPRCTSPLL